VNSALLLCQLSKIKPYSIAISGGEPLLLGNLFILSEELRKYCKRLILTTNGTLIRKYPKEYFDIFDEVQISLDGERQVHENFRGKGSFDAAINAAHYLNETVPVSLLSTVGSDNFGKIEQIAEIAKKLKLTPKIGRMCGFSHSSFSPIDDPNTWKSILAESTKYSILNDDPLNFWFDEKKKSSMKPNKIVGGCTAGIAGVAISPELDVYPCVKLRIPAGNLKEQSLKDIWLNSPLFASLRDWHNLKGHCPSCEYVSICRGCRADAWARTGDYLAPDPLCWLNGRGEE